MASHWKSLLRLSILCVSFDLPRIVEAAVTVNSTILVISRDSNSTFGGVSLLQGYGIPYQVFDLSVKGSLPALNSTPDAGNFGGIVTVSQTEYSGSDDWKSAISDTQWRQLYAYQEAFGVRMVRLNAWPSTDYGVSAVGGSVASDQTIALSTTKHFSTASLVS